MLSMVACEKQHAFILSAGCIKDSQTLPSSTYQGILELTINFQKNSLLSYKFHHLPENPQALTLNCSKRISLYPYHGLLISERDDKMEVDFIDLLFTYHVKNQLSLRDRLTHLNSMLSSSYIMNASLPLAQLSHPNY